MHYLYIGIFLNMNPLHWSRQDRQFFFFSNELLYSGFHSKFLTRYSSDGMFVHRDHVGLTNYMCCSFLYFCEKAETSVTNNTSDEMSHGEEWWRPSRVECRPFNFRRCNYLAAADLER